MWNTAPATPVYNPQQNQSFRERLSVRRNSFSDKGNVDGLRGATTGAVASNKKRAGKARSNVKHFAAEDGTAAELKVPGGVLSPPNFDSNHPDHGMPYTFDPLFVEDPLAIGNNVGRNTFRIFQVLRAFSDAHRALVASLEWDMASDGELQDVTEYPLLKCLLQSEDVVFDL